MTTTCLDFLYYIQLIKTGNSTGLFIYTYAVFNKTLNNAQFNLQVLSSYLPFFS